MHPDKWGRFLLSSFSRMGGSGFAFQCQILVLHHHGHGLPWPPCKSPHVLFWPPSLGPVMFQFVHWSYNI